MICTELYFIEKLIIKDDIGVSKEIETKSPPIPIIKIEDIYSDEFYEANAQGFKPTLRVRISELNYKKENELEYNEERYSIIRTQNKGDELILVCERKLKNV